MLTEIKSINADAPVLVIFGGSPVRRDEVLQLIKSIDIDITAYGALNEDEGIQLLQNLPRINLVMIGGRYNVEQRLRIKQFISSNLSGTNITEPGIEYPYNDQLIKNDIFKKLQNHH